MRLILAVAVLALAACDSSAKREAQARSEQEWAAKNAARMAAINTEPRKDAAGPTLSVDELSSVCRAAMAALMGRDPAVMSIAGNDGHDVIVSHRTPDDGKVWNAHCVVNGDRVSWAAITDGVQGRWRTEDDIRFVKTGPTIKITVHTDGALAAERSYRIG